MLALVDRQVAREREPDLDWAAGHVGGHAVAAAADVNVGIPAHLPDLAVSGVIAVGRQRAQQRHLTREALGNDLPDRPLAPLIRLFAQPVLRELIEMGPALEGAIAHKEVVLDVAHHPFILALGLRPGRPTGPRHKAIAARQIHKPRMEPGGPAHGMLEDRRLLIVHQDLSRHTAEPVEAPDQPFIGMLGILAVRAPDMEPPREPQRVDDHVDRGLPSGNPRPVFSPIALQLPTRSRLKPHGGPTDAQRSLRADVVPQDREPARIPVGLQLPKDHARHLRPGAGRCPPDSDPADCPTGWPGRRAPHRGRGPGAPSVDARPPVWRCRTDTVPVWPTRESS